MTAMTKSAPILCLLLVTFFGCITLFVIFRYETIQEFTKTLRHRRLKIESPQVERGNSDWVINRTVHGVLLSTGCSGQFKEGRTASWFAEFPVLIIPWTNIHTKVCPHYMRGSHRIEKGSGLTHLQAMMEFQFFDNDVDEARFRKVPEYVTSNSYSSVSGSFQAFPNGTLLKNHVWFQELDILLVFEDNIEVTGNSTTMSTMLKNELSAMTVDMLLLSSCSSSDEHQHLCTNAYAITRRGARKVTKYFDICGNKLGNQILKMANLKLLSIAKASINYFQEGLCTK